MSKIPVEKKRSGMPWWAWLLIAIAVIALLWMLWPLVFGAEAAALLAPTLAALLVPPARRKDRIVTDDTKEVAHDA